MNYRPFLYLLLAAASSCTSVESWQEADTGGFTFEVPSATRATDTSFEDGDAVGIYAVRRDGNSPGALRSNGNVADNRRYIYRSGRLVPATGADVIYPPAGSAVDFYAYYPYQSAPDPLQLDLSASATQNDGSSYRSSDHLLALNEGGFTSSSVPVSLTFRHIQGMVEVRVAKNGTTFTAARVHGNLSQQGNLQTGVLSSRGGSSDVDMLLASEDATHVLFRALLPPGNRFRAGADAVVFTTAEGGVRRFVPDEDAVLTSGQVLHYELQAQSWEYRFVFYRSKDAAELDSWSVRLTDSDSGTFEVPLVSTKTGSSGTVDVDWSISTPTGWVHKTGPRTFSYDANPGKDMRTATLTLTQAESRKTLTLTVRQTGKTSIDIEQ